MEGSRLADALTLLDGNVCYAADAEMACIQSTLTGVLTWLA